MKYEFGIMSKKWSLEADTDKIAHIVIAMHIGKNIPVAVYSPKTHSFMPMDILKEYQNNIEELADEIRNCYKTLKDEVI